MRVHKLVLTAFCFFMLMIPDPGFTQYYGYYPPQYGYGYRAGAPGYFYTQPPRRVNPAQAPYYFYQNPRTPAWREWDRLNRYFDYEQLNRSPRNPESELDYMLRTF
jgi:hypothetical protein